jgi:phenylacetate-CoA ligase
VLVERRETSPSEEAARAGVRLQERVKNAIGVSVGVRVVDPDTVERSVGKMRRIVDQRPRR